MNQQIQPREFQVVFTGPVLLDGTIAPFGWVGEEAVPAGMTTDEYVSESVVRRYLQFRRPFVPNLVTGEVATDEQNGMWILRRLLKVPDIA